MTLLPVYEHDVFVSYAHIDDEPLVGAQRGWVTTLINNLETVVRQKLGFKDFAIWMNRELARNRPLTPAIMTAVSKTATLLIILSPGYLASEWCHRERRAFLKLVQGRKDAGSQVFVVYYDKLDRGSVPAELANLLGYPFWIQEQEGKAPRPLGVPVPSAAEIEYYNRVNQLAHELSQELKRLRAGAVGVASAPEGPTVFLAEVTDDLETRKPQTPSPCVRTLFGHGDYVNGCDVAPDGDRMVSASSDTELKIWDAGTGKEICKLRGHSSSVDACSFSPDGKRVLSGARNGEIKIWDAGFALTADVLSQLIRLAVRPAYTAQYE